MVVFTHVTSRSRFRGLDIQTHGGRELGCRELHVGVFHVAVDGLTDAN